ncbi:MAG: agmatinase [Bacteroidales bacterium]|nr:agmatinase [Bacteroidales bacterium]
MRTYAGIEERYTEFDKAAVLLQSIPYDGTSTWGKGADKGFDAFLDASENMEVYDIETGSEVYKRGVHILPAIEKDGTPEQIFSRVYAKVSELLKTDKFLTFFGGEHAVSIGIIKAFYEKYPDISILQLDAHADLRPSYLGSPYNHACALYDALQNANLVQVGIRSMDVEEKVLVDERKCFYAADIHNTSGWMHQVLELIGEKVYITLDLDVFDPSVMPATGTPEPGGLDWYTVLKLLKYVFRSKNVLGFDIVELAPVPGHSAADFLVAKLYYKMLTYKFMENEK